MKKYLKSFAILFASVILGTTGVNAAQVCSSGEVEHTNYYLFLDVNNQDYISNGVKNGNGLLQYRTAAEKTNNIQGKKIVSNGEIAITNGSDSTKPGNARSWTVSNYWKKYYNAVNNAGSNLIYNENDSTSYIIHNDWFSYAANDSSYSNGEKKYGNFGASNLLSYIKSNYNSLSSSDLVKNGTSLPTTSFIDVSSSSMETTTDNFFFKVYREYRNEDVVAGSNLNGTSNSTKIWAPAVYYVTYCEKSNDKTPSKNTITYVGNGDNVTNVPSKNTFNEGECTNIASSKPKRNGYTFLGWSTNKDATSSMNKYNPGSEYCEGDITLYAIWKKNDDSTPIKNNHKLIYDGNAQNVTNVPNTVIFVEGDTLIIDNGIPVRPGYVFLGWNENKNAKKADPNYAANTKHIGKDKDITLYAIWKEKDNNEYSITYLPNTTDVVSNMPSVEVIEIGNNATISTMVPVRTGYKFLGWSTVEGATTPDENYKGGSTYRDGKDLVLYAVWEKENSDANLPENPKTGITDYIVPFSSVAIASGAGISILRKKKSFLQF